MEDEIEIGDYNKTTIEGILEVKETKYSVSYFQRDYSWGKNEWTKLFDDILVSLSEKRKHFFGFMTFYKPEGRNEIQIVEGQQRLATLTILSAVIRDILFEKKDDKWKKIDEPFIKEVDKYSDKEFIKLDLSELNKKFFKEYIQKEGKPELKISNMKREKNLRDSNKLIKDCYIFFYEKLKKENMLLEISRKATREFIVITTSVNNLRSAYILFQTLNDRGLDLTISDLLKTHLLQKADREWKEIKEDWDYITNLNGIKDINTFLRQYWLSTHGVVMERDLFDKFSREVNDKRKAFSFIEDLKKEAEYYSILLNPKPSEFNGNKEILSQLTELYILSKKQVMPILLALYPRLKSREFSLSVEVITNFVFRYMTIGAQENKELEKLFSDISVKVRSNEIKSSEEIKKIVSKKDIGDSTFKEFFRAKQIKDNKKGVYILEKIEQYLSGQKEKFSADLTLEHILPLSPDESCERYLDANNLLEYMDEWIYRLGNMTLLLLKPNKSASNKSPIIKSKEIYSKHTKLLINKGLNNLEKWTSKEIENRQNEFAEQALNIWKI